MTTQKQTRAASEESRDAEVWGSRPPAGASARERLLAGMPVTERRLQLSGVSTAVLEGGDGPPLILLHGPGGYAAHWMLVISGLVATHRVVAPDFPGHGASEVGDGALDAERVLSWLGELVAQTCASPPTLVGQLLGGAIVATLVLFGARAAHADAVTDWNAIVETTVVAASAPRLAASHTPHDVMKAKQQIVVGGHPICGDGLRQQLPKHRNLLPLWFKSRLDKRNCDLLSV